MQYLAKCKQSKLNCDEKRSTVSKFSANRSFFTKFLVFFCKKYDQNHPFLQEMLLWNIKFNFGTCLIAAGHLKVYVVKNIRSTSNKESIL